MRTVISDIKNPYSTSGAMSNWTYLADIKNISNMYPYGKSYGTSASYTAATDYRYGFNGMEKAWEIDENTNYTHSRNMDLDFPRWWSRDPEEVYFPYQSPYVSMSSNPINNIDPTGDADYYAQSGDKIASKNPKDKNNYLLTSKDDILKAKSGDFDNFSEKVYTFPSKQVILGIQEAERKSNSPYGDDILGGFHEEGVGWGIDAMTGKELLINSKPGEYTDFEKGNELSIIVLAPATDKDMQNLQRIASDENIRGKAHIHPAGVKLINVDGKIMQRVAFQFPSEIDVKNASSKYLNIVVGARDNTIYFYEPKGGNLEGKTYRATFPKEKFYELSK